LARRWTTATGSVRVDAGVRHRPEAQAALADMLARPLPARWRGDRRLWIVIAAAAVSIAAAGWWSCAGA